MAKTGPKAARTRGPALARGSAIDEELDLIRKRIEVAIKVLDEEGLVLHSERGSVRNPADVSLRDWVAMLHKIRVPETPADPDDPDNQPEPDSIEEAVRRSRPKG